MTTENLGPCIIKTETNSCSKNELKLNLPFGAILKTEILYEHVENSTPIEENNETHTKSEIIYFNNNHSSTANVERNDLLFRENHQDIQDIKLEESDIKCELENSCNVSGSSWEQRVDKATITNGFQCLECDFNTIKSIYLDKHYSKHTNPNKYNCTICDYHTHRKDSFHLHLLRHKRNTDVNVQTNRCNLCDFVTLYPQSLKRHYLIIHGELENLGKYQCNQCNYKTSLKHNLVPHVQRHCEYSPKYAIPLSKQRLRLRVCGEKCPHCDYQTCHKSNLNRHILNHDTHSKSIAKRSYTCYHCGLEVSRKGNLVQHMLRRHMPKQNKEVMYKCKDCDFTAASKGELRLHSMMHKVSKSGSAIYNCENCSFQTNYKMSLTRHLLLHKNVNDVEMYCCFMCDYKSVRKDELKSHIKRHSKNVVKDCS